MKRHLKTRLLLAGVLALVALAACDDDRTTASSAAAADWVKTTSPCQTTDELMAKLETDPFTGEDYEARTARVVCETRGQTFSGSAQCYAARMEVQCGE